MTSEAFTDTRADQTGDRAEVVASLARPGRSCPPTRGYTNVGFRVGDGSRGWIEHGPYDKTMLTAAPEQVPPTLVEQLKPGGRMVLPVGPADDQRLTVIDKDAVGGIHTREVFSVRFSSLETTS